MENSYVDYTPTNSNAEMASFVPEILNPRRDAMGDHAGNQLQVFNPSAYAEYPCPNIGSGCNQSILPNETHPCTFSHHSKHLQPIASWTPRIDPNGPCLNDVAPATPGEQSSIFYQQPPKESYSKLHCKWQGCAYSRPFSRTGDLIRHIKSAHLARGQYHCPFNCGCKPFNRKDNLTAHVQARHETLSF